MSAFSGHYPYTAGPNDAPPIPLTPQQLALAYHHFQFMQQNTMPPPPPPPPQAPVIDPALQVRDPNTNTQRLEALEREVRDLKAEKRVNSSPEARSSKRRKKSDAYLLRDAKGLSVKQEEVRKQLMKKMKTELMTLTGMARDANSESDSDSESSSAPPALEAKPTQSTSGVQEKAQENPAFILETDWMSDEISGPDTDDEAKKDIHRKLLVEAAKLTPEQESQPLWERVRPGFQTTEMTEIKDDLDGICEEQKRTQKKKSRPVVQRLNLGNLHSRIPAGTLWPFMIRQDWYDETLAVNAELESALSLYTKNPEGFGDELDDGYGGDDEGGMLENISDWILSFLY
ncbi:hypothetical protein B0H17DRAFT_1194522 [Mycena rosella]|uniref:Uncharacterized protein n=1 Tax=Mycena rosella TaxID=1033263 RepID=A0AAD7E1Y5_MYCRO|nr:hypothetical protein B0H17DRAFT_1194522 [Mycena rosella]